MFCEIYLKSAVHDEIPTIHDLFKTYFISSFFLTDPRSPILDPSFPVNLEVLLIKIVLFFRPLK